MIAQANGVARPDAADIKRQAAGRWQDILPAVTGISSDLLDGKGHPCPACGVGTDRFSAFSDFAETGGVICRHCHDRDNGDGLSAVMHFGGVDFPGAIDLVADHLGIGGTRRVSGTSKASTSPLPTTTPEVQGGSVDVDTPSNVDIEASGVDDEAALGEIVASIKGTPSRIYRYRNRHGVLVGAHVRLPDPEKGKTFRSARREGDGSWSLKAMPDPRPLYRCPEVLATSGTVFVVEGERDVETAESIGLVATTWPGGSNAVGKADFSPLAGREVVVIPDNDDAGRKAATKVVSMLAELRPQPRVRVLDLATHIDGSPMPTKGDLTDWVDGHGDAAEPETIRDNLLVRVEAAEVVVLPKPVAPLTWRPFPTDALPEVVRNFSVRGAAAIGCDPAYVLMPTIVVCAAMIGTYRQIVLKRSWQEPAVIWAGIVGESGTQKTPAFNVALRKAKRLQ